MHIIKPSWPTHADDKETRVTIFTLSIHPDGSRVATGGLDTKIKIWSTAPILDENIEKDPQHPRLLSTMTSHSGVVMCVRWSNSGRYLASGSDDNIVMLWALDPSAGGKVWGSTETNVENWKAVQRLVGHDSDVSGVAWSPDDELLASVGLDSTVLIWSGATGQLMKRLSGHEGFVKGVVFDPVGQFLATQSDDNSVKIWRTSDWGLEKDVREPFVDSPKTNLTRLTWSPEGTHLVTPNSMNGPVFVAAVINRKSWTSPNSMVGHENIVEVAAFNPLIFLRDATQPPTGPNLCTLLALSARSSISLWVTSQSQPLVVLDDVFDRDILDLSWSSDGKQLWACSSEGHIAVLTFTLSEFNAVAPPGTKEEYFKSAWGASLPTAKKRVVPLSSQSSFGPGMGTMSKPNALVARKGPGAKRQVLGNTQPKPPAATAGMGGGNAFQPPLVEKSAAVGGMGGGKAIAGWSGLAGSSAADLSKKRKERENDVDERSLIRRRREEEELDRGEYEDDGNYLPDIRLSSAPYRGKGRTLGEERKKGQGDGELRILRPAYLPREVERTFDISNKRDKGKEKERDEMGLAVPAIKSYGSMRIEDGDERDVFEWRNFVKSGEQNEMAEVAVVSGTKSIWVDYLPKWVVCSAGSPQFTAVSTEEGALIVYSPTGCRLLPTIILDSPCSFLEAEGPYLLAVTSLGTLHVWHVVSPSKALFPCLSLSPLLTASATQFDSHPTISTCALRSNGTPLIALSSGSTHAFDVGLGVWTRVGDGWWSTGSDFWEGRRGKAPTSGRGVIRGIESSINEIVVDSKGMGGMDDDEDASRKPEGDQPTKTGGNDVFRNALSLGHLEVRMKAAITLDSAQEYKAFLLAYAKKLAEEGFRNKAEELVRNLLGPIYYKPGKEDAAWVPTVLGLNKRDLLREILSVFAKSRMIASLGTEYQELLKKMNT